MLQLAEIFLAQAIERRAVQLGRTADPVVETGLECLAVLVVPGLLGDVAVLDEHLFASQFCCSRGSQSPRSRIRMLLPEAQ